MHFDRQTNDSHDHTVLLHGDDANRALTIATGMITATSDYHVIDTEDEEKSDDVDTINGGWDGRAITLRALRGAHTVVLKNSGGNIRLNGGVDRSLDNHKDTITLRYDAQIGAWLEQSFSCNGE